MSNKSDYQSPTLVISGTEETRQTTARSLVTGTPAADRLEISADPSIKIDQIRELTRFIHLTSSGDHGKAVLIHEAQHMTREAQNAALKTLEEPPASAKIVLTAPREDLLLPTVTSRCQIVRLSPPAPSIDEDNLMIEISEALKTGMAACFKLAEKRAKDRTDAVAWLDQFEKVLARRFRQHDTPVKRKNAARAIRSIEHARTMLAANVNTRLVLELLLLDLRTLR